MLENIHDLNEEYLFEMANIEKEDTGLPYNIWIDSLGKDRKGKHNDPRIKIQIKEDNLLPIDVTDDPQVPEGVLKVLGDEFIKKFAKVKNYIKAYKEVFLAHYNKEISDAQATSLLKTIGKATSAIEKLHKILNRSTITTIKFHWDSYECLFVIELMNELGEILDTKYASDNSDLHEILNRYKIMLGKDLKIVES